MEYMREPGWNYVPQRSWRNRRRKRRSWLMVAVHIAELAVGLTWGFWAGQRHANSWWAQHAITGPEVVNVVCGEGAEGQVVAVRPAE